MRRFGYGVSQMTILVEPAEVDLSPEARIIEAALRCIARWGVAKTTLEDVAREARCSRATVYRTFPGGKDGLVEAVARAEVARFFAVVGDALDTAEDLEGLVVEGIVAASRAVTHHPALRFLLSHEPETVLPRLAFGELDRVLAIVRTFAAPYFARFLPQSEAGRAAEWVARVALSYLCSPAAGVDTSDPESVRRLVRAYVLPGLVISTSTH